jgi:hypothetical protein
VHSFASLQGASLQGAGETGIDHGASRGNRVTNCGSADEATAEAFVCATDGERQVNTGSMDPDTMEMNEVSMKQGSPERSDAPKACPPKLHKCGKELQETNISAPKETEREELNKLPTDQKSTKFGPKSPKMGPKSAKRKRQTVVLGGTALPYFW